MKQFDLVTVAKEIYSDGEFDLHHHRTFRSLCTSVWVCVCTHAHAHVCVHRGLYSVCSSGEEQQFGYQLPAGPEELSQRHSLDRRLESTAGLPAVPQLPELVKGAPAESWWRDYYPLHCLESSLFLYNSGIGQFPGSLWFYPPGQMSAGFSEPAAFLAPLPWHHPSALCAKAKSPTVSRRIPTVRHLTASPSTTAKGPSGQEPLTKHICFVCGGVNRL